MPRILYGITLFVLAASVLYADDIKLKNGDVLKDVEVTKKTEKTWKLLLLDGNRKSIKATDVVSHIEKPTPRVEFKERLGKVGRKDLKGMIELGRWGLETGITKDAKKLLVKARKLDKNNEEVNALLGYKRGDDGKWRSGRSLEAYEKKKRDAELKARGWVKVKGEYVSPAMAQRLNAGLVEHEGRWVTKDDKKKLEKGLQWFANDWYSGDELKRVEEKKELREGGKWVSIDDLNEKHREEVDPWILQSEHFVLMSNGKYKSAMKLLKQAELLWGPVTKTLGDEPACWNRATRISIFLATTQAKYAEACNKAVDRPDQRMNAYKQNIGGICVPDQGVFTYWYNLDYSAQWIRHGGSQAILDRLYGYNRLKSNGYEALGAYFEGFTGGDRYHWTSIMHGHVLEWLKQKPDPIAALNGIEVKMQPVSARAVEFMFVKAGYTMHWIIENHRPVFDAWLKTFVMGKSRHTELIAAVTEAAGGEEAWQKAFRKDLEKAAKSWKQPAALD